MSEKQPVSKEKVRKAFKKPGELLQNIKKCRIAQGFRTVLYIFSLCCHSYCSAGLIESHFVITSFYRNLFREHFLMKQSDVLS